MDMLERLTQRLHQLKEEFSKGQERLSQLEAEVNETRQKMLRISGAIQVLEEELQNSEENQTKESISHNSKS
ncbi:MAG: hypothetical protein AAGC85_03930 [Bacteroidota bacterium]